MAGTLNQHWELTALFTALLREHAAAPATELFADVGMNLGFYTLLARHLGHPTVSFEMQEQLHGYVKASLQASRLDLEGSELNHVALSQQTGDIVGYEALKNHQTARVVDAVHAQHHVYTLRLDGHFSQREIHTMKIDVEGLEINVLEGAAGLFRGQSVRYVAVEIGGTERWARGNKTPSDAKRVLHMIAQAGYSLWIIRMWQQPSTQFLQPASPRFSEVLDKWPRRSLPTGMVTPKEMLHGCPKSWCHLDPQTQQTTGAVVKSDVELTRIMDIDVFVDRYLVQIDFNLLFERR